jgi:hypothetical protein
LLNVESFKSFQLQRDASDLEGLPQIEMMKIVAGSKDIFS